MTPDDNLICSDQCLCQPSSEKLPPTAEETTRVKDLGATISRQKSPSNLSPQGSGNISERDTERV